jgi:hypothetical protein
MSAPDGTSGVPKQMSLLPEPDFNPSWPSKHSLTGQALALLLAGKTLTVIEFNEMCDSMRLPAYVEKLIKKFGWPIKSWDVQHVGRLGTQKTLSRFYLPSASIPGIEGGYHDE